MGKEMPQHGDPERTPPSEEDSAEAERLKTEGNEQMKVENFEAAVHFYGKAIELNPDNETYKSNLRIAELKLREAPSPTGGAGSFDIAGLLNNPGFMSMASNLMNNPQVQQLMSGMISGGHNPLGTPGSSPSQNDLASLIQAGQQFAQQMQQQNPELIEQLRSQIRSRTPSASNDDQQE
uniref:Small glutamine rich tetratricopeptide repeat containing alpha n=1 Tax=Rousettus aegyptiacus TaxID=9407 RepID=A0A7J8BU88_ROUAE|nr:small glutamine rich tetratricopeptide repeat containing alpha [Rousettus aegyptiacus]